MLVLHYTGMPTAEAALDRLRDAAAAVSAHYVIDEDGAIYRLVDESRRAWHAGVSRWRARDNVNDFSVGIELVNPGHEFGYRPFPEPQMVALEDLAGAVVARHAIPPTRILGHSDVAPGRKEDPGELFDWQRLARRGVGIWPRPEPEAVPVDQAQTETEAKAEACAHLAAFGYDLSPNADEGEAAAVFRAFQRHFRPTRIDGFLDDECLALIRALEHWS